jgi:hypothetical protein
MNDRSCYAINRASVISDVIEGEAVIINLDTGRYYGLNESGSVLWSALQRGAVNVTGLTEELTRRYAGDPKTIQDAVETIMTRLLAEELVVESPELPTMSSHPTKVPLANPPAFLAPSLEVHTDMQDFLLVDPIHEVDATGRPQPHKK